MSSPLHKARDEPPTRSLAESLPGGPLVSVLADGNGLVIATAGSHDSQLLEVLAAFAPVIRRTAHRLSERAGLAPPTELVISSANGIRVVCRFLSTREQPQLILACLVPRQVAYRRAVSRGVRAARRTWGQ